MAKALNCSIDILLGMPFDYSYNKQNNNLTTIALSQLQRGFYKLDDKLKGIMKFDAKFADRQITSVLTFFKATQVYWVY